MKNTMKKSLSAAAGISFAAAMSASPVANADSNPFGMQNLESGYMQLAEGKCGEGKCGGSMKSKKKAEGEGKCGGKKGSMDKMKSEGKCGSGMKKPEQKSKKEGKCGEGKCGGSM